MGGCHGYDGSRDGPLPEELRQFLNGTALAVVTIPVTGGASLMVKPFTRFTMPLVCCCIVIMSLKVNALTL